MNHASLFSGIGGAEVAASMMGWQNLFHCEIQEFPRKVLDYWFPNSESYEDITKTDFTKWHGKVDVLTGGFPCQPFSLAGRRKGADDNRYLWPQMLRAIRQIHPTWVVGEDDGTVLPSHSDGTHRLSFRRESPIPRGKPIHPRQNLCRPRSRRIFRPTDCYSSLCHRSTAQKRPSLDYCPHPMRWT